MSNTVSASIINVAIMISLLDKCVFNNINVWLYYGNHNYDLKFINIIQCEASQRCKDVQYYDTHNTYITLVLYKLKELRVLRYIRTKSGGGMEPTKFDIVIQPNRNHSSTDRLQCCFELLL